MDSVYYRCILEFRVRALTNTNQIKLAVSSIKTFSPPYGQLVDWKWNELLKIDMLNYDDALGNRERLNSQRTASFNCYSSRPSSDSEAQKSSDFWMPFSTHRNKPPAAYWVNKYRVPLGTMATSECARMADGKPPFL